MWNQLIQLSFRSKVGLQAQIREMLVAAILDGHIPVGVALPSTRVLATQLGVARNTVALAYELLVNEGYLLTKSRSGHFVNPEIVAGRAAPQPASGTRVPAAAAWGPRFRGAVSGQRNIEKPRDWQRFPYPFIYGQIDPAELPMPGWRECSLQATSAAEVRGWAVDLIDGDDALLIEQIQTRLLVRRGVFVTADEILVTVGAQHALFLLATLLVDAVTTVGIENPGYPDARNIFASVPDQRDDAARSPGGAARLGAGRRPRADRGRLRDGARPRGPCATRAAKPRPQRARRIRRQPVENARARHPHRLRRRQSRPDP
jgi:GntR family transcriptional regulator/MocR family aminotransferase